MESRLGAIVKDFLPRPWKGRRQKVSRAYTARLLCLARPHLGESVFDSAQNARLQLCTHLRHTAVEIIWPGDTPGPVKKLTERHTSGIVYHLCCETDNLPAALAALEAAVVKAICISPPKRAPMFGGRPVSFYNVVGLGLVEILE